MKKQKLALSKQAGFTIIEVLVSLIIFTIVLLVNGKVLTNLLKLQAESNVQLIVIDVMQSRLQKAQIIPAGTDVCDGVDSTEFSIKDMVFYVACATGEIEKDGITVKWPILGVSDEDASDALSCANGASNSNCFVVGR